MVPPRENERLSLITGRFHGSLVPPGSALMMSYYFSAETHCRELINNITPIAQQRVNFSSVYSQMRAHSGARDNLSQRLAHSISSFFAELTKEGKGGYTDPRGPP